MNENIIFQQQLNKIIDKEDLEEENKKKLSNNINNILDDKLSCFKNNLIHTKFKDRVEYNYDDNIKTCNFFLDGKFIFKMEYEDILNYDESELLSKKIIKELYIRENAYTLIDFVKNECYISKEKMHNNLRMEFKDFVNYYTNYTENKFGANKVVSIKRISKNLELYFNCKRIKYKNIWQLSNIITKKEYNKKYKKNQDIYKIKVELLKKFIERYCLIENHINKDDRIRKSDFNKIYKKYLEKQNALNYKLNNNEIIEILLEEYNESFIKSNGIIYMKKIKFKNIKK